MSGHYAPLLRVNLTAIAKMALILSNHHVKVWISRNTLTVS